MVLSMPRPYRHPKTDVWWYRERVPADIRSLAKGQAVTLIIAGRVAQHKIGAELRVSLGTKDAQEAKERHAEVAPQFDAIWHGLRTAPAPLSFKNLRAIAGDVYKAQVARHEDNPGAPELWDFAEFIALGVPRIIEEDPEHGAQLIADLSKMFGLPFDPDKPTMSPELAALLAKRGIAMSSGQNKGQLLAQALQAQGAAAARLARNARGDYSDDPAERQFPEFVAPTVEASKGAKAGLSFLSLLDHKDKTRSLKPKTVADYRRLLKEFAAFVGHDDATQLTKSDIRRWRDKLIEAGSPKKTINDRYLASIKSVLNHGVKEFDLPSNVADGIRDERDNAAPEGSKEYTLDQAKVILTATFSGTTKDIEEAYQRAIFWVPWLCAYTGARVTEITQLRAERLLWQDDVPYLLITPEDGSTKSGRAWLVGIHKHLIDLGLIDMIETIGKGPLFYAPYPEGTDLMRVAKHRATDSSKRVNDWIKEVLGTDAPLGRPSHAWRHTFTTLSRVGDMDKEARDFMMGSRSTTDAREGYGQWPPVVLDREINKLPRIEVKETNWRPTTALVAPKAIRRASPARASGRPTIRRKRKTEAGTRS